jgi:CRISP-associated protein Cas1
MTAKQSATTSGARPLLRCAELAPLGKTEEDDTAWAMRCGHWLTESQKAGRRRAIRERSKQPLVLCGRGVSLRVEGGALTIRNGFTHYPQKQETYRFFKGELTIPPRIIMLDGSGSISFDVLAWLSEQNVPLIRIDWHGNVQSVLASNGYAANPYRVEWQRETRADPRQRMAFCIDLIVRKIEGCIKTLEKSIRRSPAWEQAMKRGYLTRLECNPPHDVVSLRALEAGSAAAYFRAWREISLQWKGLNQRPIPESWRRIGSRTSLFKLAGNRNAANPINAMLNYAYAILESQVRIQSVAEGYDPTLGIMHESREGSSAFVFDMMEPERPKTDRSILQFVQSHKFHAADFIIRSDGVCRLNPQMARRVAQVVLWSVGVDCVGRPAPLMDPGSPYSGLARLGADQLGNFEQHL